MWQLYKDLDVVSVIKNKTWGWTEHLVRMHHGRVVKKRFESKLEEGRRRGRPRLRWLEDAEKSLWQMKVKDGDTKQWTEEKLASVIKEAKALRGPYSQGQC